MCEEQKRDYNEVSRPNGCFEKRDWFAGRMPTLIIETHIHAPPPLCFDLARDITLHCATASQTRERAVAGITEGLMGLGEQVTFEGVHFGIKQRFTAQVTEYDRPHRFVDEMLKGAFRSMKHIHEFSPEAQGTRMRDTLIWISPFGVVGKMADKLFLERYMRYFLWQRNDALKTAAEAI